MSEESVTDTTIDLKKRARRRLVGAAALALLAVIVLPIVMDSEPKPTGQEIQIRIPSQENNSLAARVNPVHPAISTSSTQESVKSAPTTEIVVPKPTAVVEKPAVPPVVIEKPKAEVPAEKEKIDAIRAEAVLGGKDTEQWVVQLGAYQNTANVKLLVGKLKDMALPSYTEKLDSPQGARTRVRAGPFKSHEAADKARLRIKKIGVDGLVVPK